MRIRGVFCFVLSLGFFIRPGFGLAQFQAPVILEPSPSESSFGFGLASGDVNGDGVADLLVGAVLVDVEGKANAGQVFVFFGGAPLETSPDLILRAPTPERDARFGWAIALGDLNGDGWKDILVSALLANGGAQRGTGKVYFFFGGPSLDARADGELPLPSLNPLARFGWALAVGDVNGDGREDVLVGAENVRIGTQDQAGQVFLYEGGASFPTAPRTLQSPRPQRGAAFGNAVVVGDVNGDGFDDVLVGAPNEDAGSAQEAGRVHIFFGGSPLDLTVDATLQQPVPKRNSGFGQALAVGDVNGDGLEDALVGTPHPNLTQTLLTATSDPGEVYLFFGSRPFDAVADLTLRAPAPGQNDGFGTALALGKARGGTGADILVGAQIARRGSVTGRAYFFAGGSALDATADVTFQASPPDPGTQFALALTIADVNHDGRGDVTIGSVNPGAFGLPTGPGRVYIFPAT
ncbi:MAG: VCBS repeat-containing protein [Blastocatellia bacterium]|nr:VCBS repeat-containing protein [Blastocatellia bacterium]MCS7158442.1 VCBS repeat-containing protein [Blastocatellia bacterium]MCX7753486.1 VCBS repeat-containing protein [Blastocatellia bacterium]MDW8167877.1 FG-GAP and VCBS repeat-containing protein [Acidobacteriota bacterium]MDW8255911.1 FG-GAP and VCBS repeat-containing protein [Acidobacteriota bacterium]